MVSYQTFHFVDLYCIFIWGEEVVCTCHGVHVEFKRQFMQVGSLVLPRGPR